MQFRTQTAEASRSPYPQDNPLLEMSRYGLAWKTNSGSVWAKWGRKAGSLCRRWLQDISRRLRKDRSLNMLMLEKQFY